MQQLFEDAHGAPRGEFWRQGTFSRDLVFYSIICSFFDLPSKIASKRIISQWYLAGVDFPLRRKRIAELCSQASTGSKLDAPVYIDAIYIGTIAYHTQKYIKTYVMG